MAPPIRDVYGLVKCTVDPPRTLQLPVLPYRNQAGRLLFPLCKRLLNCFPNPFSVKGGTCAESKEAVMDFCEHTSSEREISGTWTSHELVRAMDRGYTLVKVPHHIHQPICDLYILDHRAVVLEDDLQDPIQVLHPRPCLSQDRMLRWGR